MIWGLTISYKDNMEITKSLISAATAIIMLLTGCATKPEQSG